jgi:hypothetical protein
MGNYFPKDIVVEDVQSPTEILEEAQKEWEVDSKGMLKLLLQSTQSQSGNDLIIVRAKHVPSNRVGTLFSLVHRPLVCYPVTIILEAEEKLPDVLKKSYTKRVDRTSTPKAMGVPMIGDILSPFSRNPITDIKAQFVEVKNDWVADTPLEFRNKLKQAFNLSSIKALIINLLASKENNASTDELLIDQ